MDETKIKCATAILEGERKGNTVQRPEHDRNATASPIIEYISVTCSECLQKFEVYAWQFEVDLEENGAEWAIWVCPDCACLFEESVASSG